MTVIKRDIVEGLHALGLKSGDRFVVHSSLRSMGNVEGGAENVVDAVLETAGPEGTVLMPVMTFGEPFDPARTPSRCGLITETFRRRPEAVRSLSPTHSIAGIGADAIRLLSGHGRDLPYGPNGLGSPLNRLAEEGGYVVLLGVSHTSDTVLHLPHYLAGLPFYEERRDVDVAGPDGSWRKVSVLHPGRSHAFDNIDPHLAAKGVERRVMIGAAMVRCAKARDIIETAMEALKSNPTLLLCDSPECRYCSYTRSALHA